MKSIHRNGIVEYCDVLNISPEQIFEKTRKNETRLIQGVLFTLMKREGYKTKEIAAIFRIPPALISRSAEYAQSLIYKRNPIAVKIWDRVKHIAFTRSEDLKKVYKNELWKVGFVSFTDELGVLINKRMKNGIILTK